MKGKWVALGMALVLALTPASAAFADEMIIETDFADEAGTQAGTSALPANEITQSAGENTQSADGTTLPAGETGQSADESIQSETIQSEEESLLQEDETGDFLTDDLEGETEYAALDAEAEISGAGTEAESETSETDFEGFADESGLIVSIEEIGAIEYGAEAAVDSELTEEVTGSLQASGYATDAAMPKTRSYAAALYSGSFGNQLSANARTVYNAMKAAYVDSRAAVAQDAALAVTLSSPIQIATSSELSDAKDTVANIMQSAFDAFVYDYPEVFWMGTPRYSYSYTTSTYPSGIAKVTLYMDMAYAGAGSQIASFDSAVSTAVSNIRGGYDISTTEKLVTAIHNYLCYSLTYQEGTTTTEKAYAHSAAGAFLGGGKVVCEGYAKAFKILCRKFGAESVLIVGDAGGPHMWNYVKMNNGNWYLVDVTWDDTNDPLIPHTTYLLAGSTSIGFYGTQLIYERNVYPNFTDSIYSQSFIVPVLSSTAYSGEAGHTHTWSTTQKDSTCAAAGYLLSTCTGCGEQTMQILEKKTTHSYHNMTYVYNNDATVLRDGTKSLVCDYGCGTVLRTVTAAGTKLKATIKVSATSITLKKGQSTTAVKVSGLTPGDQIKSWKSSNTKIVKVNSKGKITAQKKTGSATVTVTLLSGLTKKIKVKVQSGTVATKKISGVPKKLKITKGKKATLSPTIKPITSQQKVTYSSSNKKVATVSSKGVIRAKSSGKAKITVKSGSKKVTVTVTVPKIAPKKITGVATAVTLKKGRTKTLKPKLSPAGSEATIKYSSSNKKVAAVSSKGVITAKKKGKTVITVKAGSVSVKCKVTVK